MALCGRTLEILRLGRDAQDGHSPVGGFRDGGRFEAFGLIVVVQHGSAPSSKCGAAAVSAV
jgi:hypothetical protein